MPVLTEQEARALVARAFARGGVCAEVAEAAALHLTLTEMMGITTHGLSRVTSYLGRIAAGGIDAEAVPTITALAPALLQGDAGAGLGAGVVQMALARTMEAARETGVAACFLRNATHFGAIAPLGFIAAEQGFASFITANSAPMLAPPGGRGVAVGNAPTGIGLPHAGGRHVILDMALSVAARSKLRGAAERGETIPEAWALDAEGRPTTDPRAALKGVLQAIGGRKGAALAVTLDLMAAGLAGAAMLSDVGDNHADPSRRPDVGQMILVIDATRLMPPEDFARRLDHAAGIVGAVPPVPGGAAPRLPGARAIASLRRARVMGIDLSAGLLNELELAAG
ncbi:Ldh family oxidoreductase [Roseicyclus marinus]|uniref:Ldh family oxidoreductase n=1 Tax=Roseicyclus marinus TaxID=2161673 RepID=UPI00240FB31A|nr:Ldh family oxidoreductase [Roseicyclus marinus]MDG3040190.1 Ldh family oxidoreductase [Roseicyclus marinus]